MSRGGGGLAAGLATFNSCNKAGSIPHFTRHLQSNPTDYNALMWRGRANSIVGNMENARVDFHAAAINSSGPRSYVAQYFEASVSNEGEKSMRLLNEAITKYPESHEVLGEIGTVFFMSNQYSIALPILEKTVSIIERCGKIEEPSYCWHQHNIGSIYLESKQLDAAERAFTAALNFSESHTVSHIGYAQVQLAKGKDALARRHYDRARVLNPTLVTWTTFEAFKTAVQPARPATWYETFMNLPKTLGNMALSAIGMSGSSQTGQASVQSTARPATSESNRRNAFTTSDSSGTPRSAFLSPVQPGNAVSAPRTSYQTSTRATSAESALRTSANQPTYSTSTDMSTSRTVSKNYHSTYGVSANQSSFTNRTDYSVSRSSSSRSSQSASNSKAETGNSAERSSGGQFGSSQSTSRSYSSNETYRQHPRPSSAPIPSHSNFQISTGVNRPSHLNTGYQSSRFYPVLPNDEVGRVGGTITSANEATWDGSNNSTVEAAKKSRSSRNNVSRSTDTEKSSRTKNSAGPSRGQGNGSGDGGDGGGSDDEDNDSNEEWKKMRKESREILKYYDKEYVLSKDEKYYYSRDKGGHGHVTRAFLKRYANKKNRLEFEGSLDRNLKFMEDKHESREGTSIMKAKMDVVRRR